MLSVLHSLELYSCRHTKNSIVHVKTFEQNAFSSKVKNFRGKCNLGRVQSKHR